jgi:hypothetical protein
VCRLWHHLVLRGTTQSITCGGTCQTLRESKGEDGEDVERSAAPTLLLRLRLKKDGIRLSHAKERRGRSQLMGPCANYIVRGKSYEKPKSVVDCCNR